MVLGMLIQPLITEKSLTEVNKGWYTFIVKKGSTKHDIAQAVNGAFHVHTTRVKTQLVKGSIERRGRRGLKVRSSDYKKARVRLTTGEKIDLFTVEQAVKK